MYRSFKSNFISTVPTQVRFECCDGVTSNMLPNYKDVNIT